jgi:hypothetical protein
LLADLCAPNVAAAAAATAHGRLAHKSEFLDKSSQWACGVSALMHIAPFDAVEFFEYAGSAFYLLRDRQRARAALQAHQTTTTTTTNAAAVVPVLLPLHVPIIVRLHGSLNIIDTLETADIFTKKRRSMYIMERYAMLHADHLFGAVARVNALYTRR